MKFVDIVKHLRKYARTLRKPEVRELRCECHSYVQFVVDLDCAGQHALYCPVCHKEHTVAVPGDQPKSVFIPYRSAWTKPVIGGAS